MIHDLVQKILKEAKPPSDRVRLKIVDGVEAEFKLLADMTERTRIEREVVDWAKRFQKTFIQGRALGDFKEFGTDDLSVLAQAKMLSMLCETEGLTTETAWLQIAKQAAPVFAGVVAALDQLASNTTSDYAVYLDEKKDSRPTETTPESVGALLPTSESGTTILHQRSSIG